jgi:peptide/nickel transport system substrate-binding protein
MFDRRRAARKPNASMSLAASAQWRYHDAPPALSGCATTRHRRRREGETVTRRSRIRGATLSLAAALALMGGAASAKERLTVDLVNEPSSLDPQLQWNPDSYYVYRNIFDNLVTRDDGGTIVPQVATAWRYLSATEVEFTLRDDIVFHDGVRLTAADVVSTVKRITDPAFASPQLGQFNKIVDAVADNPTTVRLKTDGAYPALLAQLVKLSILPRHVVEAVGKDAFNQKPVGSGPYRFAGWRRGIEVVLERNETYWGAKGPFATVVFRAVPDAATRVADLQAGSADLVVTLDSDLAAQIKASRRGKVLSVLTERVAYFGVNSQRAPMTDKRLRQAVAYAIDKQALVDGVLGGYDKPMSELVSPASFGYVDGIGAPAYDPAKAKALIAEVGAAAKTPVTLLTAPVFDQRVVQAIQQMLVDVGLDVKIEMIDLTTYLRQMQSGPESAPQLAFSRWSCACQDADGALFPLLHSSSGWATARDARLDELIVAARQTLDQAQRLALYRQVHERVASEVYDIPLYQSAILYGAAPNLDWTPTPNESMFLNRMRWRD